MQPHRPAIAVVTPSILTGLGLESILRRIIPMAEVEVYDRFERFAADRPDRFFHYFVASQTFVEHNAFFLERRHKSILLTDGAPQSTLRELHCLDIAQSEEGLVRDILRLHQHAHREGYPDGTAAAYPATHPTHPSARSACDPHGRTTDETVQPSLTQREIDVLRLVVAGLLNKQIGHLPPPQPRPQARHPLRGRTDDLRRDQRVRRRRATGRTVKRHRPTTAIAGIRTAPRAARAAASSAGGLPRLPSAGCAARPHLRRLFLLLTNEDCGNGNNVVTLP